eukprot:3635980-Pyramimonas_sp.AAC.1
MSRSRVPRASCRLSGALAGRARAGGALGRGRTARAAGCAAPPFDSRRTGRARGTPAHAI